METNVLRIGNKVYYSDGTVLNIDGIQPKYIWAQEYVSSIRAADISPIQITPEILEKAGFTKSRNQYHIVVDKVIENVLTINEVNGEYSLQCFPTTFQYLHQLQNLHFALTGEELAITL